MADDIVTRLRDVVCWCNEFDGVCDACQAAEMIERLQRWKSEACSVLADWDAIYVSLGDRGELGQRKSAVVAAEIERLWAELAAWQGTVRAHEYLNAKAADEIKQLREAGIKQVAYDPDDIVTRLWGLLDGPVPMTVTREDVRAVLAEMERLRNTLEIVVDMLEEDFPNAAHRCAIGALNNHLQEVRCEQ